MNKTSKQHKQEAATQSMTMDDIAKRFLSTPPTPHKPQPKKKARKSAK